MATRVRTRISFGAFANLKSNEQQQIGLNTLITSIKNIISTFNNNFAYIVNSFNALMQFKYDINKYGIFLNKERNDNYLTGSDETDYEQILNRITSIKKRLDFLESGDMNTTFVDSEVIWYIKDYNFYNVDKTLIRRKLVTPDNKQFDILIEGQKKLKAKYLFFNSTEITYNYIQTNAINYGWSSSLNKFYTKDIKTMAGMTCHLSFGPYYVIAQTDKESAVIGTVTYGLCFSGAKRGKFDSSYEQLKAVSI